MSEKPILFSGPMVRAILAGTKTQTRRIVKWGSFTGYVEPPADRYDVHMVADTNCLGVYAREHGNQCWGTLAAPYRPGMHLWVRETHAWADRMEDGFDRDDPCVVAYLADQTARYFCAEYGMAENGTVHSVALNCAGWNWKAPSLRWRPSIHMPRWASRLTLRVTSVRVERLQAITDADALAEGMVALVPDEPQGWSPRNTFAGLWDAINGKRAAWADNPFVWVVGFERVTP